MISGREVPAAGIAQSKSLVRFAIGLLT
jgi:hypothetical protein